MLLSLPTEVVRSLSVDLIEQVRNEEQAIAPNSQPCTSVGNAEPQHTPTTLQALIYTHTQQQCRGLGITFCCLEDLWGHLLDSHLDKLQCGTANPIKKCLRPGVATQTPQLPGTQRGQGSVPIHTSNLIKTRPYDTSSLLTQHSIRSIGSMD